MARRRLKVWEAAILMAVAATVGSAVELAAVLVVVGQPWDGAGEQEALGEVAVEGKHTRRLQPRHLMDLPTDHLLTDRPWRLRSRLCRSRAAPRPCPTAGSSGSSHRSYIRVRAWVRARVRARGSYPPGLLVTYLIR